MAAFLASGAGFGPSTPRDLPAPVQPLVDDARPPADAARSARPRGVLRRGVRRGPNQVQLVVQFEVAWPLTTRVWSAGKLLFLVRRAARHLRAVRRRVDARWRCARARCRCPISPTRPPTRPRRRSPDAGLTLQVDDGRRLDPEGSRGPGPRAGPAAGRDGAPAAQRPGLAERRPARRRSFPALDRRDRAHAQLRLTQDGLALAAVSEIRSHDYPPTSSSRRIRRPRARGRHVALLVNRGERGASYVMPDLIGVNGDRAADDPARRAASASRSSARHPYPGVAAGIVLRQSPQAGFQIAPGRADFARGQPVSVLHRAVDSVGRLRGARRRGRRRRARRRRSDSRRRDGRPLRAEHHDRPAGRASRSSASPRCRSTCT